LGVTNDEPNHQAPETEEILGDSDSLDIELQRIRDRRTNPEKNFMVNTVVPQTFDDYTLVVGLISGLVFFGTVFIASSGLVLADSIAIDDTLSGTLMDKSDCVDKTGEVWLQTWVNQDQDLRVRTQNVQSDSSSIILVNLTNESGMTAHSTILGGTGDHSLTVLHDELDDGSFEVAMTVYVWKSDSTDLSTLSQDDLFTRINESSDEADTIEKRITVALKTSKSSSLWGSGDSHRTMEKFDDEPRACWTVQQLGGWGWVLMGAEWVGGRETAMLTGGSAEVPPWYMAAVSLGMSIFFLCVQYPLMHRLYHRETDDMLSSDQMRRLIQNTIESAAERLHVKPEFESMLVQDRAISVDVFLPYRKTRRTLASKVDVKGTIIKDILSEFSIFGEMRPLQIKVVCIDSEDEESSSSVAFEFPDSDWALPQDSEDYGNFFTTMGNFGHLEESFRDSMSRWFKKHDLADYGSAIMADEDAVFVRVIYRPITKFAYFLFKPTFQHLQGDLREQLAQDLDEHLDGRTLVVSARNEKSTLADRAVAGRVEQGSEELTGEAMVAKRGGIPGALLQNPFMGDILSSVEYVAHKNRSRIDRYGFWGLIVFVWIPFMASGVLVGAMLGLVARMRFERVLAACFIGGTAASITWAYTARGIIEFMERYHAEALIPFVIMLALAFTIFHVRNNKRRRREELFRDSMAFFAGAGN
tara:strand:+ start:1708 stop:3804 length:2097 start_codon:yes stop_codon:yes gene_type:complete